MKDVIASDHYTIEELARAYRDLDKGSWYIDDLVKAIRQAEKNRIVDEAMKAHDNRPDLRTR